MIGALDSSDVTVEGWLKLRAGEFRLVFAFVHIVDAEALAGCAAAAAPIHAQQIIVTFLIIGYDSTPVISCRWRKNPSMMMLRTKFYIQLAQ